MARGQRARRRNDTRPRLGAETLPKARLRWWPAAVIALAGTLTYWNSLTGPFVFDDERSIFGSGPVEDWRQLGQALNPTLGSSLSGRPLVQLSFALNYALGGLDVRGYHVVNIALHVACGLLIYALVRRTLELPARRSLPGDAPVHLALAAALLWVVHPLNSEVVDYLTQRTESMMALCYLLTLYASLRAALDPAARRWQVLAISSCALGMTCKESMVTAPIMVAVYDRIFLFPSFKEAFARRRHLYGGLAATWIVLAGLMWSDPRGSTAGFDTEVDPWTYLLNQTVMITRYLRLAIWPESLVVFYGWPLPLTISDVLAPTALIVLLLIATVVALVKRPELGFLGAWFFITLAPTSTIVPIATEVGAERRMYLPLAALVVLAVLGTFGIGTLAVGSRAKLGRGRMALLASTVCLVVAALLAAATIQRNREYASQISLARTLADRWPTSATYSVTGGMLAAAGNLDLAIPYLRSAVPGAPRARYDLGAALFEQGRIDESIEQLEALVTIWQTPPAEHPPWQPPTTLDVLRARTLLGRAHRQRQQVPEAREQFQQILLIEPREPEAHRALADMAFAREEFDDAIVHYRAFLDEQPGDLEALQSLGVSLALRAQLPEAIDVLRRAVDLNPDSGKARQNLGNALLAGGDVQEAVVQIRRAVELMPDNAGTHALFGRALAIQGNIDAARAAFERSLDLDPASSQVREELAAVSGR